MGLLGTLGKAALGATKGIVSGGGLGGAIAGATSEVVGGGSANRGSGRPNLTTGAGNPVGVMNLSGGGDASSPSVSKPAAMKGPRSLSGRRGFSSGRR